MADSPTEGPPSNQSRAPYPSVQSPGGVHDAIALQLPSEGSGARELGDASCSAGLNRLASPENQSLSGATQRAGTAKGQTLTSPKGVSIELPEGSLSQSHASDQSAKWGAQTHMSDRSTNADALSLRQRRMSVLEASTMRVKHHHMSLAEAYKKTSDRASHVLHETHISAPPSIGHSRRIVFGLMVIVLNLGGFALPQLYAQTAEWKDNAREEEDPDLVRRYRSFNEENVPPLRAWTGLPGLSDRDFSSFAGIGSAFFDPAPLPNCSAHWLDALLTRLAPLGGMTDPSLIKYVADMMELTNLSEVRAELGGLLHAPQEFVPLLNRSAHCAEQNVPLRAFACAALQDERLAPRLEGSDSFVLEELKLSLHFGIVLEKITAASVASAAFRSAVTWQMTLISNRIYERIKVHTTVTPTNRQYFKPLEVQFKKQKWQSIETPARDQATFSSIVYR